MMPAVLHRQNPWWTEPRSRLDPGPNFRRTAFFTARGHFLGAEPRHLLVLGARQIGKTTVLRQLVWALLDQVPPEAICYLRLDDPDLIGRPLGSLIEAYRRVIWPSPRPAYLLLDEVHGSPDWALQMKAWIDDRTPNRVVATGSVAAHLADGSRESGPGRWDELLMSPLDFHEYALLKGTIPEGEQSTLPDWWDAGQPSTVPQAVSKVFTDYLVKGGFPGPALENDLVAAHQRLRDDIYERVLVRDMAMNFGVRSFDTVRVLFRYLAEASSGIANVSILASHAGVHQPTIVDILAHLRQTFLVGATAPFVHGKGSLRPRHKLYLCDASLRSAVLLQGPELASDPGELGKCWETAAYSHLARFARARGGELSYWRDNRGEVDFVLRLPGRPALPIEVTSAADVSSKVSNLERCARAVGATAALVLCARGGEVRSPSSGLRIVTWGLPDFLWTLGARERAEARNA